MHVNTKQEQRAKNVSPQIPFQCSPLHSLLRATVHLCAAGVQAKSSDRSRAQRAGSRCVYLDFEWRMCAFSFRSAF